MELVFCIVAFDGFYAHGWRIAIAGTGVPMIMHVGKALLDVVVITMRDLGVGIIAYRCFKRLDAQKAGVVSIFDFDFVSADLVFSFVIVVNVKIAQLWKRDAADEIASMLVMRMI